MRISGWKPYVLRIIDVILAALSLFVAELLYFDQLFTKGWLFLLSGLAIQVIVYAVSLYAHNIYKIIWYYATLQEIMKLILSMIFSQMISYVIHVSVGLALRSGYHIADYLLVHFATCFLAVSVILIVRGIIYYLEKRRNMPLNIGDGIDSGNGTMIIGGGDACHLFIHEMSIKYRNEYTIRCIIDDDPSKLRMLVDGVPVVGNRHTIEDNVKKYGIKTIIFAIPSCSTKNKNEILNICAKTQCQVKVMPSIYQMVDGRPLENSDFVNRIRNVEIEDLLGRDAIRIDLDCVMGYVSGQVVMVTGGGGSIGSELCRQIAAY